MFIINLMEFIIFARVDIKKKSVKRDSRNK